MREPKPMKLQKNSPSLVKTRDSNIEVDIDIKIEIKILKNISIDILIK